MLKSIVLEVGTVEVDENKIADIKQIINNAKAVPEITELILFGSSAKGTATADSDVDLCILGIDIALESSMPAMNAFVHKNSVDAVINGTLKSSIDYIWYPDRETLESERIEGYYTINDDILEGTVIYKK